MLGEGDVATNKRNATGDSSDDEEIPEKVEKKTDAKKGQSQSDNSKSANSHHSEQNGVI